MAVDRVLELKVVADVRPDPYFFEGVFYHDVEPMNVGDITLDGQSLLNVVEAASATADIDEFAANMVTSFFDTLKAVVYP